MWLQCIFRDIVLSFIKQLISWNQTAKNGIDVGKMVKMGYNVSSFKYFLDYCIWVINAMLILVCSDKWEEKEYKISCKVLCLRIKII